MKTQRAVSDFITHSKNLYRLLRLDGEALTDIDLVALREQLHILDAEAGHLQELKEFEPGTAPFLFNGRRPQAAKPLSRRPHG